MAMKINKRVLAADICLMAFVLLVALVLFLFPKEQGAKVELLRGGESIGIYSLNTDISVEVKDVNGALLNTVCIKNGKAFVSYASCSGGDCAKKKPIYMEGQCIVCLPNGLTVIIRGGNGIDGVTG